MAVHPVTHPSADALRAFALGKLNDSTAAAVINHLDGCPDCCKQVAAVSGDGFLARLRQARSQRSTSSPAKSLIAVDDTSQPPARQMPTSNLPPELATNQQYEILRELGRGGMGVVYLAKNKLMDRLEVLKVVNKTLLDHPGAVERFLREIRSAAKLNHANVVGAYSAVQQGELLAFAMEYIEGHDLASLVKSQGPLPVMHACYYVQQAALGLQHAFEKGMVHRDIKPQNLILAREGKKHIVKVLDFGLAKVLREKKDDTGLTGEGKMLGTPDYIAPEQTLDAARADIRADIYSLGCTLYYLLSGHPPFSGSSLGAILLAHQMHEAKPLNLVRPEVPEELAAVVRKMMAKTPAKRYQTPLEVVQALAPFVKQGTTPKAAPELSVGVGEAKPVVKKVVRVDPPPAPAAEAAKQQPAPANVWGSLTEGDGASVGSRKSNVVRKPRAAAVGERTSRKKWLLGGGLGLGVLLLALVGMWAGGVFKVKTPEGTLVLENLPADAEVTVDSEKVTIIWQNGGKKAEVRVPPGTHKVEVKKDGITVYGEEVEITEGKVQVLTATLRDTKPIPEKGKENKDEKWIQEVAAHAAESQVKAVAAKLKERNPDFDGTVEPTIKNGCVTGLKFVTDHVTDISPLRALPRLTQLWCVGSNDNKGKLADLSPLKGMHLTILCCWNNPVSDLSPLEGMALESLRFGRTLVSDLSPLKGMPLKELWFVKAPVTDLSPLKSMSLTHLICSETAVSDLSPLEGMALESLRCGRTLVSDLSPLKGMPLKDLWFMNARVTNLSPLKGMPLKTLGCDFSPERDTEILRSIKTLEKINRKPAAEFWKEVGEPKRVTSASPPSPPPVAADSFVPLFNGKDLTGWEKVGKGDWWAENGILRTQGNESPGFLATERDYNDFELALEYRLVAKGMSGVFIHAWKEGDPNGGQFLEIQLADDRGYNTIGKINGTAAIFGVVAPKPTVQTIPNTWHKLNIRTKGRRLQVSFDSQQVIDANLDDYPNAFQRFPGLKRTTGRIALQHSGTLVEFRKIEIKELPATKSVAPPAAKAAAEEKGFAPLFNGKDLKGWRKHLKQPGNWRVEKGVLIGSGPAVSHLYSVRGNYRNFHLIVEARINDGGNSGIYFRAPFGPIVPPNNPTWPQGYEAQINANGRDPRKTGSLIGIVQVSEAPHKPNEWFKVEVIAQGTHIVIKVNDKKTADYPDDKRLYTSGHIALQQLDAATIVEFRRIEIKELK